MATANNLHEGPNIGPVHRLIRSVAGTVLLLDGLRHLGRSRFRILETGIGGMFLMSAATGRDPLLAAMGISTIAGTENNIFNLIRVKLPGQGIKPILTHNVTPRRPTRPFREDVPLADALSIR